MTVAEPSPTDADQTIDVFFVGVGKCGTSWIYEYLRGRGDVGVPAVKEPYVLDLDDAAAQHRRVGQLYDSQRPRCDLSNTYYWDPTNAERLRGHNPNARVVVTTRRPSGRVESHFAFLQRNGRYQGWSLARYFSESADPDDLVARSDYQPILDRYAEQVGADNVLLLPLELLRSDQDAYVQRLCSFMGLEERPLTDGERKAVLSRSAPRFGPAAFAAAQVAAVLRRLGLLRLLGRLKSSGLVQRVLFRSAAQTDDDVWGGQPMPARLQQLDREYPALLRSWGLDDIDGVTDVADGGRSNHTGVDSDGSDFAKEIS